MADRRTWISGLLALAGTSTFWAAMGMDGISHIELRPGQPTIDMGLLTTWTLPFTSPELAPAFVACALAPFGWMAAAWGRSPWARNVSAMILGTAALLVFGFGAMPGAALEFAKPFTMWGPGSAPYLGGGWWTLGAAAAILAASFVALPPAERPEAGEDLPPAVVRTARMRSAVATAIAAGVGHCALAFSYWFKAPLRWSWQGEPDPAWLVRRPIVELMFMTHPIAGALYLLTPILFLAALRWRVLRLPAAAVASATISGMILTRADGYWPTTPQDPAPLALGVWYLVPGALLVAALLLPPAAAAEAQGGAAVEAAPAA